MTSEDLSGKFFGEIEVLRFDEKSKGTGNKRWICKCSCGKEWSVLGYNLKNGNIKSCGCKLGDHNRIKSKESLLGKIFDMYEVVSYEGVDDSHNTKWKVRCVKCGKEKITLGVVLKNKKKKRCSCTPRNNRPAYKDIEGEVFGLLTVLNYEGNDEKHNALWRVRCECGNIKTVLGYELRRGLSSCGCLGESLVAHQLKNYLREKFNAEVEYKKIKNPKTGFFLKYDIYIPYGENPDLNGFYVEVHGEQHYRFVSGWHKTVEKFEEDKVLDKIKKDFAKKNGIYIEIDLRKIKNLADSVLVVESEIERVLSQ